MRFSIDFVLEKNEIPLDYRTIFVSLFKDLFENNDKDFFEKIYNKDDVTKKPYTFSVYMKGAKFTKEKIILENENITLNFSTYGYEHGIYFYNAALKFLNNSYPMPDGNYMRLKNIMLKREKVIKYNSILAKTLSPIVVRKHNKTTNKDKYVLWNEEDFIQILKEDIKSNFKEFLHDDDTDKLIDQLIIEPVNMKKTVVMHQVKKLGKGIEANLGTLHLTGDIAILDYLSKAGIGSRRSQGFGMLDIIG